MATTSYKDIASSIYEGAKDNKDNLSLYYKNVVKFLNKKRLLSKSPEILSHLRKIVNREEGIVEARVSSAQRLTDRDKEHVVHDLKKHYKAKDVILNEVVDARLLGGMKIEVGDEVIDLSVKGKISKLQKYLMHSV
jgi:F-type H+-transporting ATPase subunit delta